MLYRKLPSGRYKEAAIEDVHEAALEYVRTRFQRGRTLATPKDSAELLTMEFANDEAERFVCLFLDNQHRIIVIETLSTGTIDGAAVHPREVVKAALQHNAAAMIVAHNHVSGVVEPSQADEQITRRLRSALALVDIRLLDHLIIGGTEWLSLAERGIA